MSESEEADQEDSDFDHPYLANFPDFGQDQRRVAAELANPSVLGDLNLRSRNRGRSHCEDIPSGRRMRSRPSFFSIRRGPDGWSDPPKNLHAVRRHLFLEKQQIKDGETGEDVWRESDDASLLEVIRSQLMEEVFRKVYHDKVKAVPKLERADFFSNLQREIAEMSSDDLWKTLDHKVDWQRISARMTSRGIQCSDKQCYVRYVHGIHPQLKKGCFEKEEDMALLKLAARFEGFDWEGVAQYMPTARTAWRCFTRYQRVLNNSILKVGWSKEQVDRMRRSIRELGYFHDDPKWRSIRNILSRLGPGKSHEQCEQVFWRWRQNIYEAPALPWSQREHRSLELAMQIYGQSCLDWKSIGRHLPDRDDADLSQHWSLLQTRTGNWTPQEDEALRRALEIYSAGNWKMMQAVVKTRSPHQIVRRFHQLFPREGMLHDILLATRRRTLASAVSGKRMSEEQTELSASDFKLHLMLEDVDDGRPIQDSQDPASALPKRLTTNDKEADKHLVRINKFLADTAAGKSGQKRSLIDLAEDPPKRRRLRPAKAIADAVPQAARSEAPKAKAKAAAKTRRLPAKAHQEHLSGSVVEHYKGMIEGDSDCGTAMA